jgi:membrane associated rhomboid family serine protease
MRGSPNWLVFTLVSAAVGAVVVYVFGPADTRVVSSLAAGTVVFAMFTIGVKVSNEKVKQTLLDILSLLP